MYSSKLIPTFLQFGEQRVRVTPRVFSDLAPLHLAIDEKEHPAPRRGPCSGPKH